MKKRKYGRILSLILTICMVLGMLPMDMVGSVTRVSAADVSTGVELIKSTDGKSRTWTFNGDTSAKTLSEGDTISDSINVLASKVQLKTLDKNGKIQGLTLQSTGSNTGGGKIAIPLVDKDTNKVKVTIEMASVSTDSTGRFLRVGNSTKYYDVYHDPNEKSGDNATSFKDLVWEETLDSTYFSDGSIVIEGFANASGKDNKIFKITTVETGAPQLIHGMIMILIM